MSLPDDTRIPLVVHATLTPSLLCFSPAGVAGQKVRVEEELEAYPTESVDLRCMFVDGVGTKLTQVRQRRGSEARCASSIRKHGRCREFDFSEGTSHD